jgi:Pyruvate/2-oxoacid:ferredoxin oxidoreductase gamma subunit
MEYPDINNIRNFLKEVSDNIYFIKADEIALTLENPRVMNVIMLGVLFGSKNIPLKEGSLISAILNFIPKKFHDVNRKAFQIGIEEGIKMREDYNEQSILCRG